MKKTLLLIGVVWLAGSVLPLSAQKVVERTFTLKGNEKIDLNLRFGDHIAVEAWDQNKVAFKAVIEINGGKLNDALAVEFNHRRDRLEIRSDYREQLLEKGRPEDCPDPGYSRFGRNGDNYVICSNITYRVLVPHDADMVIESISGNIELTGLTGPIRAKSISGFVDLSWLPGRSANLDLTTVSGEAYTNLDDLHFDNKKAHIPIVGYTLKGRIGRGGPRISLESVSGNVYLRKAGTGPK